ncbi:sigma 54-interacting transcriptional regulator [Lysinibacillus agricola]|uniref:Sigma 54-interacting transcriptional regulator n=1 Tax=Lysinibacillus agricola TaxID=2590012 RepID=A0ABX7AM69_9BACI|nr:MULTISPECIES: sigma 54-interacting transcriptional regulator [Lysinibacillus]KOS62108.1 histidine kinase [Lysinibacillus sp. FJAT-14222]QQP10322.1 sigma 54-interacting transcriptional regulator [Lysinibacillus agricola]
MFASLSTDLEMEALLQILDYSSDEIFVLDENRRIIFVNNACERHYGLKKSDVIGRFSDELFNEGYWTPSVLPEVYEKKRPIFIKQTTILGAELLTSAIPIINKDNEIKLIVTTARELQNYKMLKLTQQNKMDPIREPNVIESAMMTNNKKVKKLLLLAQRVAKTESTILIQGESGTGKGVLAQHIHNASNRKSHPFLTINCAAIPADLLEAELFGYSAGSFTGANKGGKIGLIESAEEGTLFLDEIGELSLPLQAKLLRVIQDKIFIPIGSAKEKKVNVRIIAATNQKLIEMVEKKQFREDLFYRLNVIDIQLPLLRERKEDIIPLTYKFLYKFNVMYETNKVISEKCLKLFTEYSWPGNIRQLENVMERLVIISDDVIDVEDLPELMYRQIEQVHQDSPATLGEAIDFVKEKMVKKSYEKYGSSRRVASDLQISQTQASKLIRKYCDEN